MTRFYRLARTQWSAIGLVTLILVCGSLFPLPFRRRPEFERFGPDKVLHFLGYAAFAVLLTDALTDEGLDFAPAGIVSVCSSAAIAVWTGRLQRYVPGRAHERADVVAGILGACGGVLWRFATADSRIGGGERGSNGQESARSAVDARRDRELPRCPRRREANRRG
ncbi:putative integral membrane protein [Halovivax ruber XH-70]|uniref:Putative integral membrane protein n=1 Tax=Halovivax ruber (strain DSM 18193 / JCM 13892 / XH-70) TaxID=797302 RepID=L0IHS3_HALRX|nr:VanZ family protein [Halovivax ruber]AGB17542.1 putative integral membrane protein [Halovivax ruber XH-70]